MLRCISYYFNPNNSDKVRQDFTEFKNNLNAPLTVVEVAFTNQDFWIDNSIRISANESNMLWQPQRLINIGIESLKSSVDQIAWLDPNIIFEDLSWYKKAAVALDEYPICQLFSHVNDQLGYLAKIKQAGEKYSLKNNPVISNIGRYDLAWAVRRDALPKGLYDFSIVGNNELHQIVTWQGAWNNSFCRDFHQDISLPLLAKAIDDFMVVRNKLNYLNDIKITTTSSQRLIYTHILNKHLFDISKDIELGSNGLWQWSSDKTELHKGIKDIL